MRGGKKLEHDTTNMNYEIKCHRGLPNFDPNYFIVTPHDNYAMCHAHIRHDLLVSHVEPIFKHI